MAQEGTFDYMQYQTPQPAQNRQPSPILTTLARGFARSSRDKNHNGLLSDALRSFMAKPGGSGISAPLDGGVGTGIGETANAAAAGSDLVSQPEGGAGPLTDAPSMDIAAGTAAGAGGSGMNGVSGGAPSGYETGDLGNGLSTSSTGQGLQATGDTGVGYSAASEGGTGAATINGGEASSGGGSWGSAFTGALAGEQQGERNYWNDPNMRNKRNGFGTHHPDYRAGVGGGVLGGVLGYYGNGLGAAVAAPVVEAVHPLAERLTRGMIMTGDKIGDSAGAMVLDPVGAMASGKYSEKQIMNDWAKYNLLGGLAKYIK